MSREQQHNAFIISYADFMKPYLDNNGNYNGQYVGWTPQFDDNVSAKLNFSELANVSDPSNLYNMLSNLVGIELGFPCGTCNEMEAIRFSGYCEGMDNMVFYDQGSYVAKSEINLSEKVFNWNGKTYEGYFDAITDIIINNQSSQTANLAAAIVADLAKTTYDSLSSAMTTHYDRAIMDGTDPYSVYIYDYRDTDAIENDALDTFITTYGKIGFDYETVVEGGYYTHFDRWDSEQIWIQSGRFHFGSKNGRSRRILEKTGSVGSGGTRA